MKFLFKFLNYSSLLQKHDFLKQYYYSYYYYVFLKLFFLFSMLFLNDLKTLYIFKLAFIYLNKFLNLIEFSKIFFFFSKHLDLSFFFFFNLDVLKKQSQYLPKRIDHFSLLRSSFIYKKAQEQFGKTKFISFFSFRSYFFYLDYYYFAFGRFYKKFQLSNFLQYKISSL